MSTDDIPMEFCRANCELSSSVVQSNRYRYVGLRKRMRERARTVGHALLTRNCLRSDETNARNPA